MKKSNSEWPCMCTLVLPITTMQVRDKQGIHASSKRKFSARRWTIFNFSLDLALPSTFRDFPRYVSHRKLRWIFSDMDIGVFAFGVSLAAN